MIKQAYKFAQNAHRGQKRKFVDLPYFSHPKAVAKIVEDMGGTEDMICAAFLHDVIEDCDIKHFDMMFKKFNKKTCDYVVELTNHDDKEIKMWRSKGDYLAQKILAMSDAAKTIKLADRLHNIMGLNDDEIPFSFLKRYYHETRMIISQITCYLKLNQHTVLVDMIVAYLDYYSVKNEKLEC